MMGARKFLVSVLPLALLVAAGQAALAATSVSHYEVKASADAQALGEISIPAEIVGSLQGQESYQVVVFQPRGVVPDAVPMAVYAYTGTGAVFRAAISLEGEEFEEVPLPVESMSVDAGGVYVLRISASTYRKGAQYVVRIGDCGPFTVQFDGNGGVAETNSVSYVLGERYGAFPSATRSGYDLTGWSTATTNGILLATNTIVCAGYTNLYAQWKQAATVPDDPVDPTNAPPAVTNYVVAFDANGGSGTMPTQTFTYGEAKALETNRFAWAGHEFAGWAGTSAGDIAYLDGQIVSNLTSAADATMTLYAKWQATALYTQVVDGVAWVYSTANGAATIENFSVTGSNRVYGAAVDVSLRGSLTVPRAIGTSVVEAIGERAFADCSGLTDIVIPETVTSIGSYAFAGCSNLVPGITIPESVKSMGSGVFSGCDRLKIVRYLGNRPEAASDLYAGAPASLISGALRVRSGWEVSEGTTVSTASSTVDDEGDEDDDMGDDEDDDDDYDDDYDDEETTIVGGTPLPWPTGSDSRKVFWWRGVKLYSVRFNVNGGKAFGSGTVMTRYYVPGRELGILGDLPEPEHDNADIAFLGWYTAANGGSLVTAETVVTHSLTYYAHWQNTTQRDSTGWSEEMYADEEPLAPLSATAFQGYVYTFEGSNDTAVVGTLTLKVGRGRYDSETEETNAAVTATVQLLGGTRLTLKGTMGEDGNAELTDKAEAHAMTLAIGANGFAGTLDDVCVSGARNRFSGKTSEDRLACALALQAWKRSWNVVLKTDGADGEGEGFASGYSVLSVTVGTKGKTKVKGTMADGSKVSVTAQLLVGEGCCCVPAVVPMYRGRKGGFGLLIWLSPDAEEVWGVSEWDASSRPGGAFVASLSPVGFEEAGMSGIPSGASFSLGDEFPDDEVSFMSEYLPAEVPVSSGGGRWTLPAAGNVKYDRSEDGFVATSEANPSGLKLTYSAKDGTFKGAFKAYAEVSETRLKKYSATVTGAVVDGVGYGTATIKKVGSVPVVIE